MARWIEALVLPWLQSLAPQPRFDLRAACFQPLWAPVLRVPQAAGEAMPGDAPGDELPALEADRAWFRDIVAGACDRREEIDGLINRALEGRREVARMEITLRAILRAGVYELLARIDTPTAVVITEYVALAYDFFSKTEADLVHAILDRIGREVRHGA